MAASLSLFSDCYGSLRVWASGPKGAGRGDWGIHFVVTKAVKESQVIWAVKRRCDCSDLNDIIVGSEVVLFSATATLRLRIPVEHKYAKQVSAPTSPGLGRSCVLFSHFAQTQLLAEYIAENLSSV